MRGSLLFLDTNVLLSATDRGRTDHDDARRLFPAARGAGCHLAVCGQVLREYLAAATRPVSANGLGMDGADALHNADWFRSQTVFLEEIEAVYDRLHALVSTATVLGRHLHDLNIAAVMATHGVRAVVTANLDDFAGLADLTALSVQQALGALTADER